MKNLSNVDLKFLEAVIKEVPDIPDHSFSMGYKLKRRRIISTFERGEASAVRLRMKYIAIIVIAAAILALAGFGIAYYVNGLSVTEFDIYSTLYMHSNENAPQTIEEKFYLDIDLSGFTETVLEDSEYYYAIDYDSADEVISVDQSPSYTFRQARLNTENARVMPEECYVNGWGGIYFCTANGAHCLYLNTGDYIMFYLSNISKERVMYLAEVTKFVEN